ncbi:MAG: hypothetical protein U0768_21575 [Anaerolineae bacterium]
MTLRVTVFGDPANEVCLISGCGSRVSSAEAFPETAKALRELFGDHIALRYYDLSQPGQRARFAPLVEGARARGLRFPLVAVNGAIVAAADESAPYPLAVDRLLSLIDAALADTSGDADAAERRN